MHREYGVPVSTSAEQCAALHPDLVVVAVMNKASIAAVSTEWLARGFAVLSETPAALEEDALRAPLAAAPAGREATGGRAVLAVPHAGKTAGSSAQRRAGHAAVCPAVGGARLPRGQSGAAVPECRAAAGAGDRAQLDGKRSSKRIPAGVRCITAHWWKKTLQQHTLEFAGGGTAFLDFNGVQYHSYLRSTHTSVQGERGEVFDDTLRCLDAAGEPVCRQLTPLPDPLAAAAAQAGLNEDETAIACFLDRMQGYLAGGAEVYPLADALQDAYLALLMERALAVPGQSVESTPQPWNTEEG